MLDKSRFFVVGVVLFSGVSAVLYPAMVVKTHLQVAPPPQAATDSRPPRAPSGRPQSDSASPSPPRGSLSPSPSPRGRRSRPRPRWPPVRLAGRPARVLPRGRRVAGQHGAHARILHGGARGHQELRRVSRNPTRRLRARPAAPSRQAPPRGGGAPGACGLARAGCRRAYPRPSSTRASQGG